MDEEQAEMLIEDEALTEAADAEPVEDEQSNDDEEIVITIGKDAAPASEREAPEWAKQLRVRNRELVDENNRLKGVAVKQEAELPPKPKPSDFDYDDEAYESAFDAWKEKETRQRVEQAKAEEARNKADEAWQGEIRAFESQKQTFAKVKGWEDAEATFVGSFSDVQQAILINAAPDKALLVYALGSNQEARERLSKLTDLSKFAFEAGLFAGSVKMERRKPSTSPESAVTPSAPLSAGVNKRLAELEAKAEKTGDRTELIRYRKSLKAA
jgi:hypothetical protein